MGFQIITAEQRVASAFNRVSMAIFGPPGVGKTRLALTLDPADSYFIDLEAGTKSLNADGPPSTTVREFDKLEPPFNDLTSLAVLIGGPDPAASELQPYSQRHYDYLASSEPELVEFLAIRKTIFIDSISEMTRLAFRWAEQQPDAVTKYGTPDTRAIYGKVGNKCVRMLKHLQHAPGKNVIFVGLLDKQTDDAGRETFVPQTEGSKVGRELPGIVDQVVTMSRFINDAQLGPIHQFDKPGKPALCCQGGNPWGLPAKDRTGRLGLLEPPDLGALIARLNQGATA